MSQEQFHHVDQVLANCLMECCGPVIPLGIHVQLTSCQQFNYSFGVVLRDSLFSRVARFSVWQVSDRTALPIVFLRGQGDFLGMVVMPEQGIQNMGWESF